MKPGLIVMAKAPVPSTVKTRLCPPYTFEQAAGLYRCFLLDTFDLARRLRGVAVVVAYLLPGAEETFRALAPTTFELMPQRGNDLGERLNSAFERLFSLGYERVATIGADSPTLPLDYVERAFELLAKEENDLVLGPSADGGYYLIGMKAFHPELFQGVTMGTERVLSQTLERARQTNLRVSLLPPWYDVDTQDDLERLRAELRATPQVAMHTRAFLYREVSYGKKVGGKHSFLPGDESSAGGGKNSGGERGWQSFDEPSGRASGRGLRTPPPGCPHNFL